MRFQSQWFVATLGAGLLVLAGCGDDDDPGEKVGASVRTGTWSVTTTTTTLGSASECNEPVDVETTSESICDDEDLVGDTGELPCNIDVNGDQIDMDCQLTTTLANCTLMISVSGGGTFTETTYDITVNVTATATPPTGDCASYNNPCTQRVRVQGTWQNATGNCPTAPLPVRSLISRGLSQAIASR